MTGFRGNRTPHGPVLWSGAFLEEVTSPWGLRMHSWAREEQRGRGNSICEGSEARKHSPGGQETRKGQGTADPSLRASRTAGSATLRT